MRKIIYSLLLSSMLFVSLGLYSNLRSIKPVKYCYLGKEKHSDFINVSGKFESTDEINIKLSYPVYVKKVFVSENSVVNKGQALFSVDKDKMINMLDKEISKEDIDKINYKDIKNLSSETWKKESINSLPDVIYASDSGVISKLNIYDGSISMANKNLLTINKTDEMVARFTVSQLDYGKIGIGDKVEITPVAFSNKIYNGRIKEQNAIVKQQMSALGSRVTVDVFASIDNVDRKVCDGLQINGKILKGEPKIINTLDYSFIHQDDKAQYVYILENGKAAKKYISTGIETEDYAQILTEFDENTIFISGNINDGDRVILQR